MPPYKKKGIFVAVPAARSDEPTAHRRATIIIILLVVAALMGFLALAMQILGGSGGKTVIPTKTYGKEVADQAAMQALTGVPLQIPTVTTLPLKDIDGPKLSSGSDESGTKTQTGTTVRLPYPVSQAPWTGMEVNNVTIGDKNYGRYEVHSYLLIPSGQNASGAASIPGLPDTKTIQRDKEADPKKTYEIADEALDVNGTRRIVAQTLQITVLTDSKTGDARLAAAPSFSPYKPASKKADGFGDYSDLPRSMNAEVPSSVSAPVGKWAKAYIEDDRKSLLEVTGDQRKGATYLGLGNLRLPSGRDDAVKILTATTLKENRMLLRVRLKAEDNSVASSDLKGRQPSFQTMDYDLVVANATAGQPSIVAWGPAGTGFKLQPYQNALTG